MSATLPPQDRSGISAPAIPLRVTSGTALVMFAFDVGMGIDLAAAERLLGRAERAGLALERGAPSHLQFRPRPLRVERESTPRSVGERRTLPKAECTVYDFGAISVAFHLPISGTLAELTALSRALLDHAPLAADAADALALAICHAHSRRARLMELAS